MFNRFRDSIFKPKKIAKYSMDKIWFVLLYVLIMTLICLLPTVITVATFDKIPSSSIRALHEIFEDNDKIPNIKIENYILTNTEETSITYYDNYSIGFNNPELNDTVITVIFNEEGINIYSNGIGSLFLSYKHLDIQNLDFGKLNQGDSEEFKLLITYCDNIVNDYKMIWGTSVIIYSFIEILVVFFLFILFLTFFEKLFCDYPFKIAFNIISYSSTVFFISFLLSQLLGMSFIYLIGIVISVLYANLSLKSITVIKINKNTLNNFKNNHDSSNNTQDTNKNTNSSNDTDDDDTTNNIEE